MPPLSARSRTDGSGAAVNVKLSQTSLFGTGLYKSGRLMPDAGMESRSNCKLGSMLSSPICVPEASNARTYMGALSRSGPGPDTAQMDTWLTSEAKKMLPSSPPALPNCKAKGGLYGPPSGVTSTEGHPPQDQMLAFGVKVTPSGA